MGEEWEFNGSLIELGVVERETLLHLHDIAAMQTTTDILHAVESIGYRRKALRVIDTLADYELVHTHQPEEWDETHNRVAPPKHVMLSQAGEQFVADHTAELAMAEMDHDDLREDVYHLREKVAEQEAALRDRQQELEDQIRTLRRTEMAELRADVEQVDEQVEDVENVLNNQVHREELVTVKRQLEDELTGVRADFGDRITDVNARVGNLETTVDVLDESVDQLEDWIGETEAWIEDELLPTLRRIEPVVKTYEARQRDRGESSNRSEDFGAVEGLKQRLFSE